MLHSFVGEERFEAVKDQLRQGSALTQGRLKNSVYIGHPLGLTP